MRPIERTMKLIFSKKTQTLFGDCVYGTQDAISLLLGYCSILFWLNAQLPYVLFLFHTQNKSHIN